LKDTDFKRVIELTYMGGGWIPANQNAEELSERCVKGEIVACLEVTNRDLKFHKCYFSLIGVIYDYLPPIFKNSVLKEDFYMWLKHLKKQYKVIFEFQDGTKFVKYESISFGKMSQKRFQEYVAEQLPWIYENVIGAFYEGEMYDNIVETIEQDYQNFMERL